MYKSINENYLEKNIGYNLKKGYFMSSYFMYFIKNDIIISPITYLLSYIKIIDIDLNINDFVLYILKIYQNPLFYLCSTENIIITCILYCKKRNSFENTIFNSIIKKTNNDYNIKELHTIKIFIDFIKNKWFIKKDIEKSKYIFNIENEIFCKTIYLLYFIFISNK